MKITIQGDQGSGKSTVATLLAERLKYPRYSVGTFMRELATRRKMTLLQLSAVSEHDKGEIDHELDAMTRRIGETKKNFVLEGRLGYHFIPDSFKVYLRVSLDEAARRIFANRRPEEKENTSLGKTKENILRRKVSEAQRYKIYYGIIYPPDPTKEGFDLVIDTTRCSTEGVVKKILDVLKRRQAKKSL